MISFQPLVDTEWNSHLGFYIICTVAILFVGFTIAAWNNREIKSSSAIFWIFTWSVAVWVGFNNSYVPEKIYPNNKVTGEFVNFIPEIITEKSGKSGYIITRELWVVYKVGDELVTLPAKAGVTYPKFATLYKN